MTYAVTLVIPILNEAASLAELLGAIKAQTLRPKELVFSDAGSSDGSPALIEEWWRQEGWEGATCKVLVLPGAMPGAGRNAGVRAARCEWIAFLDGGIEPETDWLEKLCRCAEEKKSPAMFGVCHFSAEAPFDRAVCALSYGFDAVHPVIPASLFRRSVFDQIGFFPENLRAAEDLIWVQRLVTHFGGRDVCQEAMVHYRHFPSRWMAAIRKWRITEYHCVLAGARLRQQIFYVAVLPLLYCALFSGSVAGAGVFVAYLALRGVVDPLRRSRVWPWWGRQPTAAFIAPGLAAALDVAKFVGILQGFLAKAMNYRATNNHSSAG